MKTYLLGIFLAAASGWVQVRIHDLLLTALMVLASAMLLGALAPERPWRWALGFLVVVPLVQIMASILETEKTTRGEFLESLLTFLPATVGAYGGAVLRRALRSVHNGQ